jgi:hypothetical protein
MTPTKRFFYNIYKFTVSIIRISQFVCEYQSAISGLNYLTEYQAWKYHFSYVPKDIWMSAAGEELASSIPTPAL